MIRTSRPLAVVAATILTFTAVPSAEAALPVIDVASLGQLVQQINYWRQQILAMNNQLASLQRSYNAMTGPRGLQNLLPLAERARNYLPHDYAEIVDVLNNVSADYQALSREVRSAIDGRRVLTDAQLGRLSASQRQLVEDGRRAAALLQVMSESAYKTSSNRFASLQPLIGAIGGANDAKAIAELQSRTAAEQAMLTNDQTKLIALAQISQANAQALAQQQREQTIAGHGEFATRFQPVP